MDWKLVNADVGTWKFSVSASIEYLSNEDPGIGPASSGNTCGFVQVNCPVGSISIGSVWSSGDHSVVTALDPSSAVIHAWIAQGVTIEAEGIVKRFARIRFPSDESEIGGGYAFNAALSPEVQGDMDVLFEDRVESYHVKIWAGEGYWEGDVAVPEGEAQTNTKINVIGRVGSARPGHIDEDEPK